MIRELRLSSSSNANLVKGNARHIFAARHALSLYRSRAVYTFIPKIACTTLRYSIAIANGCLRPEDDPVWVDENNATFVAGLSDLLTADYTFVILRCPYRRLASAFLDKLTRDTPWRRRLLKSAGEPGAPLTFRTFAEMLQREHLRRADHHWAPQVDFLVYRRYDDVFCLESYEVMRSTLQARIGLTLHDTRARVAHGLDKFTLIGGEFANVSADEIGHLRAEGRSPGPENLYDDAVRSLVEKAYVKDLNFYRGRFGAKALLFSS